MLYEYLHLKQVVVGVNPLCPTYKYFEYQTLFIFKANYVLLYSLTITIKNHL